MKTRIYFLDNLRTFIILLVIILHAAIIYSPILENIFIVSDESKSKALILLTLYLDIFVMFVMFFISGYFIPLSLKKTNTIGFLKSKFKRIMVPWTVAVFTLIPLYKMIFLHSRGLEQQAWYTYFLPFQRPGGDLSFFADNPVQSWLWFLPLLFIFQVAYMILHKSGMLKLKISLKQSVIIIIIAGVAYSMLINMLDLTGWYHSVLLQFQRERIVIYFMVFLLGSQCNKLNIFDTARVSRSAFAAAATGLLVALLIYTVFAINLLMNIIEPGREQYFISHMNDTAIYYASVIISMLLFLYILTNAFRILMNKGTSLLKELSKNSYSVYIIHMVVTGAIALLMIKLPMSAIPKFIILATLTFVVSNVIISAYKRVIGGFTMEKYTMIGVPVAAIMLSIAVYAEQERKIDLPVNEPLNNTEVAKPEKSLHIAVIQGDTATVRQHIAFGSDLDSQEPTNGSSPLITAALFGRTEIAIMLINGGADINFRNKEGSTALHTAAFFCHEEIVKVLLAEGADLNIRNNHGSTALESVKAPFENVKGIYEYFSNTLGPLGLELDYEKIRNNRPVIAMMLDNSN